MKFKLLLMAIVCQASFQIQAQNIFHTSVCYDLLSTIDQCEDMDKLDPFYSETGLVNDSLFIANACKIHKKVRASNLCNLYSTARLDKNNTRQCIRFFSELDTCKLPENYKGAWLERILSVKDELTVYLSAMEEAGYGDYWKLKVEPKLLKSIADYTINPGLLDDIHREINALAGPEPLSDEYPKTYVLDIGNAFNLLDETFCTTYMLLDREIAKKFRIDFIQVYIHENLHRLQISPKTMQRLEELKRSDEFYRKNEAKAEKFREGLNEAFVVAAESYISHKLGLKTTSEVYTEFTSYCDGTLVLAPIIYTHLPEKGSDETFDSFINHLFDEKIISAGNIKNQYDHDIMDIKANSDAKLSNSF